MKTHICKTLRPGQPSAYLANGLIGLRVPPLAVVGGSALVNGFVGRSERINGEAYAPAPYPLALDIQIGSLRLSERPDLAVFKEQAHDFATGELTTRFAFQSRTGTLAVEVLTFACRTYPALVCQETSFTVDQPMTVQVLARMNPMGIPGAVRERMTPQRFADGVILFESRRGLSTCGSGYASTWNGPDLTSRRRNNWGLEEDEHLTEFTADVKPGTTYRVRQFGCLLPDLMHEEPHLHVIRHLATAADRGFETLREDNRAAWAVTWEGRLLLHGVDARLQDTADAAFYYLNSTATCSTPCSVAPFGLSQRHYYNGHIFWDTETFMFPPLLLTNPAAARTMLDYRSRQLDMARFNAMQNGHEGLQFPWQTGNGGSEATTAWCGAGGPEEIHISMDVAFAFAQYAHATGDDIFTRQQAWPVLEGVARWICSRTVATVRGYEIHNVVGIDETIHNINNNAFTNALATVILRKADALARRLGFVPPARWLEVANKMFIPVDADSKAILKHDTYTYEGGMCVPETLAAFFPFGWSHTPETDAATVKYHLDLAHTYMGMPMLSALMGVYAARAGNGKLARELMADGVIAHLVDPFMQFNEVADSHGSRFTTPTDITVFLTNPAGFLMACMYGLTGMQLGPEEPQNWFRHPVALPEGWEAIEVKRVIVRDQPRRLLAQPGERAQLLDG